MSTIKQRFPDFLIASTNLDKSLVPGLDISANKGPIVSAVGLDKIAERVTTDLTANGTNTSHARPSMFAWHSSFASNIREALNAVAPGVPATAYASLPQVVRDDFAEWQGMVAAVALSNVYSGTGLDLSVMTVKLDAKSLVHRCILIEMTKDFYYRDAVTKRDPVTNAPLEGYLFYICQKEVPFALYHPEVGLSALREYDATVFDGIVPWYKTKSENCHEGWVSVMEPNGSSMLDDFCLSRIAWWAGQNGRIDYQNYVQIRQQDPAHVPPASLVSPKLITNATNIDNVPSWKAYNRAAKFGTTMMFYRDLDGTALPLPELFMDTMLLTHTGGQANNKLVYNSSTGEKPVCFRSNPPELADFAPVTPLHSNAVALLKSCTLEQINFDPILVAGCLSSVTTEVQIRTAYDEIFTVRKSYDAAMLRQGRLPYLMVWPFVPMPANMQLWKEYYATWHEQTRAMIPLRSTAGIIPFIGSLGYDFQAQAKTYNIYRPTALNQSWTVCTGEKLFQYALLTGKEDENDEVSQEMGIIFIPAAPTYNTPAFTINGTGNEVNLAIDFGTTSTVCALRASFLSGGAPVALPFKDYSRTVTCEDETAKKTLDMQHWLGNSSGGPNWKWDRKIFSVAQLFQRNGPGGPERSLLSDSDKQKYYVDGRMFLVSGAAMTHYANAAQGATDPLLAQQIMADMKFNETLDVKNYQAASVFLAGVYTYAVLYLLSERVIPGTHYIKLLASYPNPVTLDALTSSWDYASKILNGMMAPVLTQSVRDLLNAPTEHFFSEATATTAYNRDPSKPLAFVMSLVTLDIGGGTTDISITNNPLFDGRVRTLSMRYAGREIMVSSLIECFRRFSKGAVFGMDNAFGDMWSTEDKGTLLNQFVQLCCTKDENVSTTFLHSLTTNSTVRMTVEMLLADGMKMGPAATTNPTNLLRQLITLKFLMVLQVTARAVRENIDMWKDLETNQLRLIGDQLQINLSVSGTSAQLLQYVFDCDMSTLQRLQSPIAGSDPVSQKLRNCLELFNLIFSQELSDYLKGNQRTCLQIFVDPNVKEKREVSFGLLQSDIAKYVSPTSAPVAAAAQTPAAPPSMVAAFAASLLPETITAPVQDIDSVNAAKKQKLQELRAKLSSYSPVHFQKYLDDERDANGVPTKLGLVTCMKLYEQIFFAGNAAANRGMGAGVPAISSLLQEKFYAPHFPKSATAIAMNRAQYMMEEEQDPYVDLLACMYLVDELLDWEIADAQL